MDPAISRQAERLYSVFAELVRRYQFRDRDHICCHGLSVSQCYTLDALSEREAMSMGDLAGHLCLKISSVTRVVDQLVDRGLAKRGDDPNDRRVCLVQVTSKGRALVSKIQGSLVQEYEEVLRKVPPQSREAVIAAIEHLLAAFEARQCCGEGDSELVPLGTESKSHMP